MWPDIIAEYLVAEQRAGRGLAGETLDWQRRVYRRILCRARTQDTLYSSAWSQAHQHNISRQYNSALWEPRQTTKVDVYGAKKSQGINMMVFWIVS